MNDFSVNYGSIEKSDILNIQKCFMTKNNIKCLFYVIQNKNRIIKHVNVNAKIFVSVTKIMV